MRNSKLLIIITLLLGIFIYFYKLSIIPNGFYIDEALPAYNAYSILKTGEDEYGKFLPIVFRFYGSYNPPLYTYLTIIPVWILGLNVFSARLISVLSGLLFLIPLYLILKESKLTKDSSIPLIGVLMAVISPWLILHSRVGYEVTLGLMLFSFGIYFLWKALDKPLFYIWASIFLSLATYASYSDRFIVPLFIIGYLVIFWKKIFDKSSIKCLLTSLIILIITQIPNFYLLFTPSFFPKTNLIGGGTVFSQAAKLNTLLPIFISVPLAGMREYLSQYVTYFSPQSLFFLPDPDLQRSIPTLSVFYFWMVVPYLIGIYLMWKNRKKDFFKFLILLLVVAPIPAAATKDPFATHRAIPLLFPLLIVMTIGVDKIKSITKKYVWTPISVAVLFISAVFLWRGYFIFLPKERAIYWEYGFDTLATEIKTRPSVHFVIDQSRIKPAYINLAFYLKYPPDLFQNSVDQNVKKNYYTNTTLNNYYDFGQVETRNIEWKTDPLIKQILVGDEYTISESQAMEHKLTKVIEIRDPLNRIIFLGWETRPESGYTITNIK